MSKLFGEQPEVPMPDNPVQDTQARGFTDQMAEQLNAMPDPSGGGSATDLLQQILAGQGLQQQVLEDILKAIQALGSE